MPITTSARQGAVGATVMFCLGMTGYLALLAADGRERLRIWGRLVTLWQSAPDRRRAGGGPDTRALAASGRRIGLAAVSLALFVPLLVPGLQRAQALQRPRRRRPGNGTAPVALPDAAGPDAEQLHARQQRTVLTYRTTEPKTRRYQYLQMYVLNYDTRATGHLGCRSTRARATRWARAVALPATRGSASAIPASLHAPDHASAGTSRDTAPS